MRTTWLKISLAISALLVTGCNGPTNSSRNLPPIEVDMSVPDVPDAQVPGGQFGEPTHAVVVVSEGAPDAVAWTSEDVHGYLEAMGLEARLKNETAVCVPDTVTVRFVGDGIDGPVVVGSSDQTWGIEEQRCGTGSLVDLYGGGLLGRQYAGYAWLHELGVRFFHPEEEFVPVEPRWSDDPLSIEKTPDFTYRSVSLHLTHPLELGDAFRLGIEAYAEDARRYIDWQIKNFASYGHNGAPFDGLRDYGTKRGFPRSAGFSLHNQQQGGGGIVDPDSPLTAEEQIAAAIDARMGDDPSNYPEQFHFTFNPSEFTELPDETIVGQLTFIADYMADKYPDTIVMTTNHGTAGEPTEHYGVRFYDLPKFAPKNLGVKVHTLMFYDLERPAPVYGNDNFNYLYDFMVEEYRERRIWYYPESAWWLTFDISVPLYLPITIEARDRDIQSLAFMLDGKLDGHRVFGSGHEWGYWQNEYCSLRMSADLTYRWTDCLDDIVSPLGDAGPDVKQAVMATVELQQGHMFDAEMLRWILGSDAETELAAQIGIQFHPLPPLPSQIMKWSAAEIDAWEAEVAPRLQEIVDAYQPIVESLRAAEEGLSGVSFNVVNEIADGTQMNLLRARHGLEVHSAVIAMRKHRLGLGDAMDEEASRLLELAEDTTAAAARVTRQRSDHYRYKPRTRAIAGGEDGTEDENWTGYTYRYLNRVQHVFYYRRTDSLAREAIEGVGAPFEVSNVVLAPDEPLTITMLDEAITDVTVFFGDGNQTSDRLATHQYVTPDVYGVSVDGTLEANPWTTEFDVAQLSRRVFTGRTGVLIEPQTDLSGQIEAVLPALVVGPAASGDFILGTAPGEEPEVGIGGFAVLPDQTTGSEGFSAGPADVDVPLSVGGETSLSLTILNARLERQSSTAPVHLSGDLRTQAVIDALVGLSGGAFDPESARTLVADALGYTADTLPETVPFVVEYTVTSP